ELGHTTAYTYDLAGRLLTSQDPVQATAGVHTTYAYDPAGNLTSVTDALGHVTTSTYDARNRPVTMVAPASQETARPTAHAAHAHLVSVTTPLDDVATYAAANLNRLSPPPRRTEGGHGTQTLQTAYGYDPAGNRTSVTDGLGHATTYVFDERNRLTSETAPAG